MKLSNNFTSEELEFSQTANARGIDNYIPVEFMASIKNLTETILQSVRDKFGPVIVTSGYRSPELNKAVGGSPSSQHTRGEACDFKVPSQDLYDVALWIEMNIQFDQLILEPGWIHVSSKEHGMNRQEVLTFDGVHYTKGLG